MQSVRTSPAGPVVRNKKQDKVSIAHRLRRSDLLLFLAALTLGGIGVLAIYAAEADYRQAYAVNQAMGLSVGFVGAVVMALLDYRWLGRHLRLVYGSRSRCWWPSWSLADSKRVAELARIGPVQVRLGVRQAAGYRFLAGYVATTASPAA